MKQQRSIQLAVAVLTLVGLTGLPLQGAHAQGAAAGHNGTSLYPADNGTARLFKDVEGQCYTLRDDAETMQSVTPTQDLDSRFYGGQLTALKSDVNRIGKEFPALMDQSGETPAQERVAKRLRAQLESIASTVSASIQYINTHQSNPDSLEFRNLTLALSNQTQSMWQTIHDAVTLADVHAREQQLRKGLARAESGD